MRLPEKCDALEAVKSKAMHILLLYQNNACNVALFCDEPNLSLS